MWSIGWQVLPLLLKSTQCYHMLRPSSRSWLRQLGLELLNLLCVALALLVQILSQCLLVSISPLPRAKMWNIWNYELYKFDLVRKCNHPGCSLGGKQAWIGCSQRAVATWDNCLRNSSTSWPWRLRSSSKSWAFGPISESVSQNVFPIFVKVLCSGYNSMLIFRVTMMSWCDLKFLGTNKQLQLLGRADFGSHELHSHAADARGPNPECSKNLTDLQTCHACAVRWRASNDIH